MTSIDLRLGGLGETNCCRCSWSTVPMATAITSVVGVMITYGIARFHCHIQHVWLPYISDTGNYYPETMLFSLLCNLICFGYMGIIILAWRMIYAVSSHGTNSGSIIGDQNLHRVTCGVGIVSCLGIMVIAKGKILIILGNN